MDLDERVSADDALRLTEDERDAVRAEREGYLFEAARQLEPQLEAAQRLDGISDEEAKAIPDSDIQAMISREANERIIAWEVGSRAEYERKYKSPEWPGGKSGITIGFGYDLGFYTRAEFQTQWGPHLTQAQLDRLSAVLGKRGEFNMTPAQAHSWVREFRDIEISWDAAQAVYSGFTVPSRGRMVLRYLAHTRDLHPHSFGALVSLVFNRGTSFYSSGDRYKEMRDIRAHMSARAFNRIPDDFRAMKRIWAGAGLSGLLKRRDGEALLFQAGIDAASAPVVVAGMPSGASSTEAASIETITVQDPRFGTIRLSARSAEDWQDVEEMLEREGAPALPEAYSGKRYTPDDVRWIEDDTKSPDYRHLDLSLKGSTFSFTAKDLELVIEANGFAPIRDSGRILFGLRGALLRGETLQQVEKDALELQDARPDHRRFRCVIGVYNTATQKLSGFAGSTVPNIKAVHKCWSLYAAGKPLQGNLLPTGCYSYYIGAHGTRQVPGCFKQGRSDADREKLTVLRSPKDVSYDIGDFWDAQSNGGMPYDNIHPSFYDSTFSSEGCQTVRGTWSGSGHNMQFEALRRAAGLSGSRENGRRFDYVLITGLEAAIASNLRARGLATDATVVSNQLTRLRHGSRGEAVKALQRALGIAETGVIAKDDKKKLVDLQLARLGYADGVYSPEMDAKLGFQVLTQQPTVVAGLRTGAAIESAAIPVEDFTSPSLAKAEEAERIEALMKSSLDSLYYEVGLRSALAARETGAAGQVLIKVPDNASAELGLADLKRLGARIVARAERDLFDLVCGSSVEDAQARERIRGELTKCLQQANTPAVVAVLAATLIAQGGIIPAIATVVASVLARKVLKGAVDETCNFWREALAGKAAERASV